MLNDEEVAAIAVDVGLKVHRDFGPGLLESAYEVILAGELKEAGLHVRRQVPISITYKNEIVEACFKIDLLLNEKVIIELKSVEKLALVHHKQLLTYLRITGIRVGLLMNFGGATFKDGLKRMVNGHQPSFPSCLRVNQPLP